MEHTTLIKTCLLASTLLAAQFASADVGANGSPVVDTASATQIVTVASQTADITVRQNEVLGFALANGKQFGWKFDGTANFVSLAEIAPKDSGLNQDFRIYVAGKKGDHR